MSRQNCNLNDSVFTSKTKINFTKTNTTFPRKKDDLPQKGRGFYINYQGSGFDTGSPGL